MKGKSRKKEEKEKRRKAGEKVTRRRRQFSWNSSPVSPMIKVIKLQENLKLSPMIKAAGRFSSYSCTGEEHKLCRFICANFTLFLLQKHIRLISTVVDNVITLGLRPCD